MAHVYVTGHRNPDTDTIASAIGYAELKGKLNPEDVYAPARLGDVNAQTRWALDRSGAVEPKLIKHIKLRVKDVMSKEIATVHRNDPLRNVGLAMAKRDISQVPIVDDDGALVGIVTERGLARMYTRESREPSTFAATPVSVGSMVEVLEGELLAGEDKEAGGKLWVISMSVETMGQSMEPGDIVVIGDRPDGQRRAIELGAGVLVVSNGIRPEEDVIELGRQKGTTVVLSPLDSYVTSRMIQLSVPCWEIMAEDPLTVDPDELITDITDRVMEVHYRAAIAVDGDGKPLGIVTRTDLLNPEPRRVLLVDHAERGQSVPGVEEAQVVEILDHHHIGDVQTRTPIPATFDPVGSTATLVVERYRENGLEPTQATAGMLLAAVLSDTVVLNSPTTTERDHEVVRYLEGFLGVEAEKFGMEMFEASSDVSDLTPEEIVDRDLKEYGSDSGERMSVSQIETVGTGLLERKEELMGALEKVRQQNGYLFAALMVTDIIGQGTELLCVGECAAVERAFDTKAEDSVINLPGVMSRKKQVAPQLLAAF
ncbi:putative manganese-dependent inorganic diphosphatase [Rubrobacter marinus]|uniref:inorganic diphosphatase n=1 Tax=Rubrobacter marinus TaxID=2653852 RepID=A0A6G8PZ38_9ACTN|nr:putative manganese-dependent inorganic diphosphatase [Rubrobacter marinus]QIN79466.1 putative manganese-dependent inorganic diphosphatase [Rubrobacter marinus]